MTVFRILLIGGAFALAGAIYWALGADTRGLGPVIAEMLREPWSLVTLIDLYLGFAIAAIVVGMVERSAFWTAFWALPIFLLGNVWTAVWFVLRLPKIAQRLSA
ncbi:MAG: hypothetical protein AAF224_02625 [Pseudomonadota bacterium]